MVVVLVEEVMKFGEPEIHNKGPLFRQQTPRGALYQSQNQKVLHR
jgi:hypothetical protein